MTEYKKGYGIVARHEGSGGGFQAAYKAPGSNGSCEGDSANPVWIGFGPFHATEEEVKTYIDELGKSK